MKVFFAFVFAVALALSAQALTIDTVVVGNPGNPADNTGFGAVNVAYRIGATEISNAQYVEFLNAVAKSDPYSLYDPDMGIDAPGGIVRSGSPGNYIYSVKSPAIGQGPGGTNYAFANKPVGYVNWYDALRFVNWLNNGQGSGDTETGAYTLGPVMTNGIPVAGNAITRNPGATWFLPSENEWYKAAYYKGSTGQYFDYATSSDTRPNNHLPASDTGNSANYYDNDFTTGNLFFSQTDVGAYTLSKSPYGTFDQNGNVWEWTETRFDDFATVARGGSSGNIGTDLLASVHFPVASFAEDRDIGFRVATIPEPATFCLGVMCATVLPWCRHSRQKAY